MRIDDRTALSAHLPSWHIQGSPYFSVLASGNRPGCIAKGGNCQTKSPLLGWYKARAKLATRPCREFLAVPKFPTHHWSHLYKSPRHQTMLSSYFQTASRFQRCDPLEVFPNRHKMRAFLGLTYRCVNFPPSLRWTSQVCARLYSNTLPHLTCVSLVACAQPCIEQGTKPESVCNQAQGNITACLCNDKSFADLRLQLRSTSLQYHRARTGCASRPRNLVPGP